MDMKKIDLRKQIFSDDRKKLRKELICIFLDEEPGTGIDHNASRYKYIVYELPDGKEIYLSRPANLNNGFDFTLNVSGTNFNHGLKNEKGNTKRASTRPTHDVILKDLSLKKSENTSLYKLLFNQIDLIYNCKKPTKLNFTFEEGYSTELILVCIKWLFIEQDVTYWNYSGRGMFYNKIKDI